MKNINLKKTLTGVASLIIIAGMAIQSFATNVDMAAFVKKDAYMTKYYELDWRIDDIEKKLERMYKFVCTNVRTYAGGTSDQYYVNNMTNLTSGDRTYQWRANAVPEFSEEGYLRVNTVDTLNTFAHGKTDRFTLEVPAPRVIWRKGIEVYPETKVKFDMTRIWPNTTSINATYGLAITMTMGPFKKFPHISSTGTSSGGIFYIKEFNPYLFSSGGTLQYRSGSRTLPTSWNSMSGVIVATNAQTRTNSGQDTFPDLDLHPSIEDFSNNIYSMGKGYSPLSTEIYVNTVFGVNLSTHEDIWIKYTCSYDGSYTGLDLGDFTLTTWNNNK